MIIVIMRKRSDLSQLDLDTWDWEMTGDWILIRKRAAGNKTTNRNLQ